MNKLLVSLVLSLGVAGSAYAQAPVEGNAEAGAGKVAMCGACHGADGNSTSGNFPKLAGQGDRYLFKQLADIKEGRRVVVEMTGMLDPFNEQDLADIAAYFSENTMSGGVADPELAETGEKLYRGGRLSTGLPACTGCHSPTGKGNEPAGFPHLAGQHAAYTVKQLTAFREGERTNDGDTRIMQMVAEKLSNRDIEAVANYIQGLR
ncbi:cytochrome c oxidase, cbb3-type, subunit III [Halopseudomonas xinjiangensis]|uniref:Cytochrome c oxidase, cbb3-type, subunit III n=1 Tax=Halopseudomonas xinjiangensis TaxID=487184 RepID=A0A1H1Y4P8_9GAMM|nr:c-type cytochrome [Halopseudomonas xinjiangensis]SDT16407.1 cytochrome c oxidase, cbb3-type, subunit III [Halopseudomonas xinjiangensis]